MELLLWYGIGVRGRETAELYYRKLEKWVTQARLAETQKAMPVMRKYHEGQERKGEGNVPYIIHPLMMAMQAFSMGIRDDRMLAAILLHDVCEDCGASAEELMEKEKISKEVLEIVECLTFHDPKGQTRTQEKKAYFERIAAHPKAAFLKVLDRCSNLSTMAASFTEKHMATYIEETQTYVMPLLEQVVAANPDYEKEAYLLHYQMRSLLNTIEALRAKKKQD